MVAGYVNQDLPAKAAVLRWVIKEEKECRYKKAARITIHRDELTTYTISNNQIVCLNKSMVNTKSERGESRLKRAIFNFKYSLSC